jgi:hypothetical protein
VGGNHLEDNLAKFGYTLYIYESKKPKPESLYGLGYLVEIIIKIWRIWAIFFP